MQELKNIVKTAIRAHYAEVQLFPRITENDVYMAIRQVMRDNPDIFWFSHRWNYSQSEAIVRFRYAIDKERSEKIKKQIKGVVENDFKLNSARNLSVKEQVMYVYKWIALYCNYNIHSAHNQTIYSVFALRHSVCTGIAKAAQYLLDLLGIESRLIFGKLNNSEKDSRHCWLIVKIEEKWYHLDPTFALPDTEHLLHQCGEKPIRGEDYLFYNFFCVDTASIKHSRTIEEEDLLPVCNDKIEYADLQNTNVTPSRNGEQSGLGCLLSDIGTTADIYLAHSADKHVRHRSVAKVFKDDTGHELLRKELIVMRECAGTHLLRAVDADIDKGILYMEQAIPLSELLASHYFKLTVKGFCNLLIDIASGLKELLGHGIIYRDIHLNNIYLSEDLATGELAYKLGDFGSCTFEDRTSKFAGLTEQGGVGSMWYMAPETWNEGTFDERSAVYGVGMIAYYLLNDLYPPFWREYGEESLGIRMQSHRLPMPSKLQEGELCNLRMDFIFKSLSYDSSERYQTLSELIEAINECKQANQDRLLIEGSEFKTVHRKPKAETFCSTCEINPSVIVSNGEVDVAIVDIDGESNADILLIDSNADGHIDSFDATDKSSQVNDFATTCGGGWNDYDDLTSDDAVEFAEPSRQIIDDFATTCIPCSPNNAAPNAENRQQDKISESYFPCGSNISSRTSSDRSVRCAPAPQSSPAPSSQPSKGLFSKIKDLIFGKSEKPTPTTPIERKPIAEKVNSSVFAPAEIAPKQHLLVQVYLHLQEETEKVKALASEADKSAERRGYEPLEVPLKKGDNVEIELNVNGDSLLYNCRKSVVWQGSFVKRAFDFVVPSDIDASELSCSVNVFVNGAIAGELIFLTAIVDSPRQLNTNIYAKPTRKLFISYSHKDVHSAEKIAKIHEALGIDVFFDKHRLKAGYIYSEEISQFIQTADTFVLCWSENAAKSDYVEKERQEALALAYPQSKPRERARLRIHPYNIEPHAVPPADMIEHYHFEEL